MKMAFWQHLAVLTILGLGAGSFVPATAAQFEQQEIDQSRFILVAAPGGDIGYKLLIIEQLNNKRPCWSETGSNPSQVDPLLLSFDFTGICNRIVDSNGFSMRAAGTDHALQYSLRVVQRDNDLVLIAASNTDRNIQIELGSTNGIPAGFSRIVLNPGWRLTRRAYNGRAIGHVYLTYDQPIDVLVASARRNVGIGNRLPAAPAPVRPGSTSDSNSLPGSQVIPVPSLPPTSPELPAPLPPLNSSPAPSPNSSTGAPNLSTILPPPPVGTAQSGGDSGATPPRISSPPRTTPPAPRPDSTIRTPSRVPTTSNRGGAPLGPRVTRRATTPSATAPSATPSTTASTQQRSTTSRRPAPDSTGSTPVETAANGSSSAEAGTYQVIVVADNAETQDKVRAISPNALLTTINGQVVMQVGVFRDRQEADRLQQRLSLEGLPTAVIPVR